MEKRFRNLIESQVSEVELVYRSKVKTSERPLVKSSSDCATILRGLWDEGRIGMIEEFKVLYMNRANRVIGFLEVSSGGVTSTVADSRIIFAAALKLLACYMVIAHNHPSGCLRPSQNDEDLTRKIKQACEIFDMKLLDHIILTDESYFSFADEGLL